MQIYRRLREGLIRTRDSLSQGLGLATAGPEPDWEQLEEALIGADVGLTATGELVEAARLARDSEVRHALADEIKTILLGPDRNNAPRSRSKPEVVLIVGVNGVGKTTTVAKLAHRSIQSGRKTLVIAADTFRAAAVEQLEAWVGRIHADMIKGSEGTDAASVVHDGLQAALARQMDEVIIDTAGRLHTKRPLMDELAKVKRIAGRLVAGAPHQTLLVMDATVGGNGLAQARQFSEALGVDGIVLAKLDGTAKGGIVVAVARELGIPVRFTGVGEGLDDLLAFSPDDFAEALVGDDN